MDTLQFALFACDFLNQVTDGTVHWLSDEGQLFPMAVRKFFHETACHFHRYGGSLPDAFCDPLAAFIKRTRSHVATLNYDNLIYQPLIEREVLRGYNGALVDGLCDAGFSPSNLERMYGHNFGYYLHLHGSPLFVDRHGAIRKLAQSALPLANDIISSHIVLTHIRHKPLVIGASPLLTAYWQYLQQAITESTEIIMIGYSGADEHLNDLLRRSAAGTPIRVVEWSGEGAGREAFWAQELGRSVALIPCDSILEFDQWDAAPLL